MILYFDNLITDIPLFPGAYKELDKVRESNSSYRFQDRLKVTMYALASYAEIKWSKVIIKYQIDPENIKQKKQFERFVRKLWPKAYIIYGRSDNIHKFREIAKLINSFKDEWIFYVGNNDHPLMAPNKTLLEKCLKIAKELNKKNKYVSVLYSHFPESLHMARKGTTIHDIGFPNSKILKESEDLIIAKFSKEYFASTQIINKNLFNRWLFSEELSKKINSASIKRIEMVYPFIRKKDRISQLVILPKEELCMHFDGYSHTEGTGYFTPHLLIPPLFIPPGFFEKKIKISLGYPNYRQGWVNINPFKKKYSFRDSIYGTDLMISLKDIPLFWKKRIKKIDINPKVDLKKMEAAANERKRKIKNIYFKRTLLNWPIYEAYIYQFRIRYLIKRVFSTIKPLGNFIKDVERRYKIKL
jgi:hypothetical protein